MTRVPKRFSDRLSKNLRLYQSIVDNLRTRDVSEADTVTAVKDILAYIFGYDKYSEVTSEQQIKNTFCDLAIKIDGKTRYIIEVKSAASNLADNHLRQAINYGANEGIEWVILTNSIDWSVYRVVFGKPITHEEVISFNLIEINANKFDDVSKVFLIAREATSTDAIASFHQRSQLLGKYMIAQTVLSETIIYHMRRELRKLFPDVSVDMEQIKLTLERDVLKREVLEGDKATEAHRKLRKATVRLERMANKATKQTTESIAAEEQDSHD